MGALLRWWLLTCLTICGLIAAGMFGFYQFLYDIDKSFLGFLIVGVYVFVSVWIGLLTYHGRYGDQLFTRHLHTISFFGESMMALGMIGTLIGYLFMVQTLGGAAGLIADASAAQKFVANLAHGLGTSSIVTLVGLVAAIGIRLQLVNLEYLVEDDETPQ